MGGATTTGARERPEDWAWSSFRHYLTGQAGLVETESHWTARHREQTGISLLPVLLGWGSSTPPRSEDVMV